MGDALPVHRMRLRPSTVAQWVQLPPSPIFLWNNPPFYLLWTFIQRVDFFLFHVLVYILPRIPNKSKTLCSTSPRDSAACHSTYSTSFLPANAPTPSMDLAAYFAAYSINFVLIWNISDNNFDYSHSCNKSQLINPEISQDYHKARNLRFFSWKSV